MKLRDLEPGKYIVAVSGGVDSIVLLNLLSKLDNLELVVAHFNHGIRPDSGDDEKVVSAVASRYGLVFTSAHGNLGQNASEETARQARYKFLESVKKQHQAHGIITAHHQDDLIETALVNILRGTGPQGLVAIQTNSNILRPMLGLSKKQIYAYAKKNKLTWREDPTNQNTDYLRNRVRHKLVAKLTPAQRRQILNDIEKVADAQNDKDSLLKALSASVYKDKVIDRSKFGALPSELANELLVFWFRQLNLKDFDKNLVDRTNVLIRTALPGTKHNLKNGWQLSVTKLTAQFSYQV